MVTAALQRERMVGNQLVRRGIEDPRVLAAMRRVPREDFLPDQWRDRAYEDSPLPIEAGQTISQPYIVALMAQAARIRPGQRVLEIGAGSGYAAAVLAELTGSVHTVERLPELAATARRRLDAAGYGHVRLHTGDGTRGWPEAAPYDAILVAAGGPQVPPALLDQLKAGGRLVMPVGDSRGEQRLVRLTRHADGSLDHEDLGGVRFVPLVGEDGWDEAWAAPTAATVDPVEQLRRHAEPLPAIEEPEFAAAFDRFAAAPVWLLGECSHGSSEFYRARAAICRRLVEQHGLRIIALEADWPDAAAIDRHVRHLPPGEDAEAPFQRFPTWMWRNREFAGFVAWLRAHNAGRPPSEQVSVHGLDLYSLGRSMRAVIDYLEGVDPGAAEVAKRRYGCLQPWAGEPAGYGRMAMHEGYARCEDAVLEMLKSLRERREVYAARDGERFLDADRNASLVRDAEAYYRAMYRGGAEAWNIRDRHMFDTLAALREHAGPGARAVVWAHNSHVGDARQTGMGRDQGEWNLGQLCREAWPGETAILGFGTHAGEVAAADDWDEPMQVMKVRPARADSVEALFHATGLPCLLADLRQQGGHPGLHTALAGQRLQRFIGVIYRPHTELQSHYAEASLSGQYDGYVWFDRTGAVEPLPGPTHPDVPDTFPFGV